MRTFKPAYNAPDTPVSAAPVEHPVTPPVSAPPVAAPPVSAPPIGTPPVPPPPVATPPATPAAFTPVSAPWEEGKVWQIDGRPWWESIAEEPVRKLMEAKQYANPAVASMAYHNLNKLQNGAGDVLAVPGENATPEQRAEFEKALRAKRGVPETVDAYKLDFGTDPNDGMKTFATATAHKYGLTNAQAQELVNEFNQTVGSLNAAQLEQEQQQEDTAFEALEKRWGAEKDTYINNGKRAVAALGLDAATMDRIEGRIGTAAVVELMGILGSKIGENAAWLGNNTPGDPNDPNTMTAEQAKQRIATLQNDADFQTTLRSKTDPRHTANLAVWEALHAKSYQRAPA